MNQLSPPPLQSFPVEGMTCASCVRRVEKAIAAVPGVESASVNLATERADVRLAEPATSEAVIAAIKAAGYDVSSQTIDLGVEGMTCASCVARVEKAIDGVPGVVSAAVNLATERATVKLVAGTPLSAIEAAILQDRIASLLTRPVGRPPHHVVRTYASFSYQAGSWDRKRRVVAKVEWHPGEFYPHVGFIVTNLSRQAVKVVAFYKMRDTCEQWIKEGKGAIKWTRLSCRTFAANAVRLQLHALAYNLGNFLRTLATPEPIKDWSLTSLREKLIKIGAKVISHGRYVAFQMAEVAVPRDLFRRILANIADLRSREPAPWA